ncbi:MAG: hypothetical protein J6R67_07990 [Treponema sp.]|nr:hypothetical protein [Treponema sp.]
MAFNFDQKEMIDCTTKETDLDKYGVWVKKPPHNIEEAIDEPLQESTQQEEILQESELENSPIDEWESLAREETGIIDVDFLDDFTNNITKELDRMEETIPTTEDVAEVAEISSAEQDSAESTPDVADEEISIDDFLNDTNEVSLNEFLEESGEISLDTFIDTPHQEKNDILEETPMEMELTFDDDFSIVTTPDPTTQIDDTSTTEEIDDFDQMFENIVDESAPKEEANSEQTTANHEKQEFEFDEVNEFDDLLNEFSQPAINEQKDEGPKDYNLTVSVDDEDLSRTTMSEIASEEDENENIILDTPEREEKNSKNEEPSIARLQITDYTGKSYNSDDFDVDKIMAEVEDIGEKTEEIQPEQLESSCETFNNQQVQEETQDCTMEMTEEAMELNQNEMEQPAVSPTDELIRNIAGEIALLRNEITSLRNEFEAFKCGKVPATEDSPLQQEVQQESSGGFFADDTGDDTIALSGDELSNIFNTADFTEESVDAETQLTDEDPDNGLPSMDFDAETLEEPVIEDDYFQDDEEFSSEIDVPTGIVAQQEQIFEEIELEEEDQGTEEIFGEDDSTETDTLEESFDVTKEQLEEYTNEDEVNSSTEEITEEFVEPALDSDSEIFEEEITEPVVEEFVEPVAEEFVEEITDEPVESVFESSQWEAPVVEEITEETEAVVEEATEEVEPVVEEVTEETESVAEDTAQEPVESAFEANQWEAPAVEENMGFAAEGDEVERFLENDPLIIEEPVDTISIAEEELLEVLSENPVTDKLEETEAGEAAIPEETFAEEPKTTNIPDDLKQDIKSVLSYMDQLLDNLPEDKIAEFARSEHFELYKKLFTELGL